MNKPFTFYATFDADSIRSYIPNVPLLLPASSWARHGLKPPRLPAHITHVAADSGGFVATKIWGDYRYTLDEYVTWLFSFTPCWAAMMDYCCEPEITAEKKGIIQKRQAMTTANIIDAWTRYRTVPWTWVPTIQGWNPEDYYTHATQLKNIIYEMQAYYGEDSYFRIGIGTLCKRANSQTIRAIVSTVQEVFPSIPIHLWGIKLASLKAIDLHGIASTDSAAWHGKMYRSHEIREEAMQAQMSIREYGIKVKLPEYREKIARVIAKPILKNPEEVIAGLRKQLAQKQWTIHLRTRRARIYIYAARRRQGRLKEIYLGVLDDMQRLQKKIISLPL